MFHKNNKYFFIDNINFICNLLVILYHTISKTKTCEFLPLKKDL